MSFSDSSSLNGLQVRKGLLSAAANISLHRNDLNRINLFPVPDRDTGTNLYVTFCSLQRYLNTFPDSAPCSAGLMLQAAAKASLRSSRGNSGAIFAIMLRGAAKVLGKSEVFDSAGLAAGLKAASDTAYASVRSPQEGTVLTLCRKCSRRAASLLRQNPDISCRELLDLLCEVSREELLKTPEKLTVLQGTGLVDSGAMAFCLFLEGFTEGAVYNRPVADTLPAGTDGTYVFMEQNVLRPGVILPDIAYTMVFSLLPGDASLPPGDASLPPGNSSLPPANSSLPPGNSSLPPDQMEDPGKCCRDFVLLLSKELNLLGTNVTVQPDGNAIRCRCATEHPEQVLSLIRSAGALLQLHAASHAVTFKVDLPVPPAAVYDVYDVSEISYVTDPVSDFSVSEGPCAGNSRGRVLFHVEFTLLKDAGTRPDTDFLRSQLSLYGQDIILLEGTDMIRCDLNTTAFDCLFHLTFPEGCLNEFTITRLETI